MLDKDLDERIKELVKDEIESRVEVLKSKLKHMKWVFGLVVFLLLLPISLLAAIGFTDKEIVDKARSKLMPSDFMAESLLGHKAPEADKSFRARIVSELGYSKIQKYPESIKADVADVVWKTLETADESRLTSFLNSTKLDDFLIDSYQHQINKIVQSPSFSEREISRATIESLGESYENAVIGRLFNRWGKRSNCGVPINQERKQAIVSIPVFLEEDGTPSKEKKYLPWIMCPGSFEMSLTLRAAGGAEVNDVFIVGVERTASAKKIEVRVTNAVRREFRNEGVNIGEYETVGALKLDDIVQL